MKKKILKIILIIIILFTNYSFVNAAITLQYAPISDNTTNTLISEAVTTATSNLYLDGEYNASTQQVAYYSKDESKNKIHI